MVNPDAIQKAVIAHAEWKSRLHKTIETGKVESSVADVRSDSKCQFGKWLQGEELTPEEKQTVHYRTVKQLHTRFHEEAARVLELVVAGQKDAALKAVGLLGSYATASAALTNALAKWQTSVTRR